MEETQYSNDLYEPRRPAYLGNDVDDDNGDGGEDSEATPSY